jgi:hypothetical protein
MALFNRKKSRRALPPPPVSEPALPPPPVSEPALPPPLVQGGDGVRMRFSKGDLEFEVAGAEHRWDTVRAVAGKRPRDDVERVRNLTLQLLRDPGNQYDANAIAVVHDKHGQIGFVPRDLAKQLAPALDKAARKMRKPVTWLFTAEMTAEWYDIEDLDDGDDANEPVDVQFVAMLDPNFQARPAK